MPFTETHLDERRRWIILGCASQGTGSADEDRLRALLSGYESAFIKFNRAQKRQSFLHCLSALRSGGFDLFVLEGTGFAAGIAAILARLLWKRPYVLSSGDAVGPFLSAKFPIGAPLFAIYERLLYRCSSGYIGWTPYLVGRALTLGAKRAVTIPGWAPFETGSEDFDRWRQAIRVRFNIPKDAVLYGVVGSLSWSTRLSYCYGAELIRAAVQSRGSAFVLIVGEGSGLNHLRELAGDLLDKSVFLCGAIPRHEVPCYLAAMDVGSLPQSVDGVGSFRYTTKLPEYRAAGLKIVTGEIPMAYDLNRGDTLIVNGDNPWSKTYIDGLVDLMSTLRVEVLIGERLTSIKDNEFQREAQITRVTAFFGDLLRSLPKQSDEPPKRNLTERFKQILP